MCVYAYVCSISESTNEQQNLSMVTAYDHDFQSIQLQNSQQTCKILHTFISIITYYNLVQLELSTILSTTSQFNISIVNTHTQHSTCITVNILISTIHHCQHTCISSNFHSFYISCHHSSSSLNNSGKLKQQEITEH